MSNKFIFSLIAFFSMLCAEAIIAQTAPISAKADLTAEKSTNQSYEEKSILYCSNFLHISDCSTAWVSLVSINAINNTTVCTSTNGTGYTVYPPAMNTTTSLAQNSTYNLTVTINGMSQSVSAWFDWNANGVFESTEWFGYSGNPPLLNVAGTYTIPITVPATAVLGSTGFRIRSRINNINGPNDACMTFGSGETEDYTIQVTIPTSSNDLSLNSMNKLSLQPNPASDEIYINYSVSSAENVHFNIMDLTGREVNTSKINLTTSGHHAGMLNVSELKNGLYLLQLISDQTSLVRYFQVIH